VYSAAEAQVKLNESVTGISEEMADVGLALDRAENKMDDMKARAEAIDELMEAGTLEDLTVGSKDYIDHELSKLSKKRNIESELSKLKVELVKGPI
jgi:phage shock protein A